MSDSTKIKAIVVDTTGVFAEPPASACAEIHSITKGFLPPRMTTVQKNAIASPNEGLMVYDITMHKLCVWDGSVWQTAW